MLVEEEEDGFWNQGGPLVEHGPGGVGGTRLFWSFGLENRYIVNFNNKMYGPRSNGSWQAMKLAWRN